MQKDTTSKAEPQVKAEPQIGSKDWPTIHWSREKLMKYLESTGWDKQFSVSFPIKHNSGSDYLGCSMNFMKEPFIQTQPSQAWSVPKDPTTYQKALLLACECRKHMCSGAGGYKDGEESVPNKASGFCGNAGMFILRQTSSFIPILESIGFKTVLKYPRMHGASGSLVVLIGAVTEL